jgi:hypothetical protein
MMNSELLRILLVMTDEEVGPACSNVQVPDTIATDEAFRDIYAQGYRHALVDVRRALEQMREFTKLLG